MSTTLPISKGDVVTVLHRGDRPHRVVAVNGQDVCVTPIEPPNTFGWVPSGLIKHTKP